MSHLRLRLCLVFGTLITLVGSANAFAAGDVVVSQVYGGGGNAGATLKNDFIEVHNRTAAPVNVTGWSVQYASFTGTTWATTALSGTIPAGGYYLVQEAQGTGGTVDLPTPDATGTIAMAATAGKVALVANSTPLSGSCPAGSVDLVGYGVANCSETTPTPATSNTTAALRGNNGCTDTDDNSADFTIAAPSPRNSASAADTCGSDNAPSLASSAPSNGATDVATGSSISLTFSEPVNVTDPWFTIQCVVSGSHSATVSGGPTTFALQPIVAFAEGESCTVTLAGSAITDQDAFDPPDAVVGNPSFSFMTAAPVVAAPLVISEVYGGGGNTGATFTNDFIELYNSTASSVSLAGWSVQYASSAGTTWQVTPLSGSIPPGRNYLIQEAAGAGGTTPLPSPDATGTILMSATTGKVALVSNTAALSGACPTGAPIVDFVGYGAANCSEGSPTAVLSNTTSAQRNGGGATDTNNNASDFTIGAPDPRSSADQAPKVSSTTPAGGASGVAPDSDVAITFSEPVDVADGWFSISCATSGDHSAVASGGPVTFTLNPATNFAANEQCTVTVLAANVTDTDTDDPPNNMAENHVFSFQTIDTFTCGDAATPIHAVQGSGAATPMNGAVVTVEGVVVGDYQGPGEFSGYYLQEEAADADADPLTSEGIFVFSGTAVSAGDVVRVRGTAGESFALTQISSVTTVAVCSTGSSVSQTAVSLPVANVADLERYEGMLVRFDQTLTATEVFNLGRFGEVSLSGIGRLYNPTAITTPGAAAIAQLAQNNRSRIILDDGNNQQNIDPTRYPQGGLSATNTLRVGDTLPGLTGVMDFRFSNYRIQPVGLVEFAGTNLRTPAPAAVGGNLKVASFNVLNYFNGDGAGGGFPTSRGAETTFEFDRQEAKIVSALKAIDADIVGLMEIENDSGATSALAELVGALNAATAPGTYAFINTGVIGTDEIKVAVIYKPAAVTPVGDWKILTSAVDPRFIDTRSRPTLAQTFRHTSSGHELTVAVNHLKSKGSGCEDIGDPDTGDGSGNCNGTRTQAAAALADWLATDPTDSEDPDFLIIGDLNSYTFETPITTLESKGYTNLVRREHGLTAYSYVFNGESGYLDHALATSSLSAQVTGVSDWHINPDEPTALDYNTNFKSANHVITLYDQGPYRASDHDPVIIGVQFNHAPTADAGGPYSVAEGSSVPVTASGSDADGDTLSYTWDLDNDGVFGDATGQSTSFTAAAIDGPATRTIRVQVTDGDSSTVDEATVNVTNVAPTATFNAPASVFAGFSFTLSLTGADDAAPADEPGLTYAFNCGDSSGYSAFGPAATASCPTTFVGSRSVRGKVSDNDGGVTEYTATVAVVVTSDSLCALTNEYSSSVKLAERLCAFLERSKIRNFIQEVDKQAGKAFTENEAAILIALAEEL